MSKKNIASEYITKITSEFIKNYNKYKYIDTKIKEAAARSRVKQSISLLKNTEDLVKIFNRIRFFNKR